MSWILPCFDFLSIVSSILTIGMSIFLNWLFRKLTIRVMNMISISLSVHAFFVSVDISSSDGLFVTNTSSLGLLSDSLLFLSIWYVLHFQISANLWLQWFRWMRFIFASFFCYKCSTHFSSFNQPLFCCYYSIFFLILDARFPIVIRIHSLDVCIPVFFDILSLLLFRHSWIFLFLLIATLIPYLVSLGPMVPRFGVLHSILFRP